MGLFRASLTVAGAILLGRFCGFFREILLAHQFGLSAKADLAVLALTLPDLLISLLVGGAMAAVLVPVFLQAKPGQRSALFAQSNLVTLIVFSLLALLFTLFPQLLVNLFAPGMQGMQYRAALHTMQLVIWVLPLSALAGVSAAYLQSQQRLLLPGLSTFIFNSVLVMTLLVFSQTHSVLTLFCLGIIVAALVRWILQLWQVSTLISLKPSFSPWLINFAFLKRYSQAIIAGGVLFLFPVIARTFASFFQPGSIAAVNYAYKLVQLPISLVMSIIMMVLLPRFSKVVHVPGEFEKLKSLVAQSLQFIFILTVAAAAVLVCFSHSVVQLVYAHGVMTSTLVSKVAQLSAVGFLTLPLQCLVSLMVAIFNAHKNTRTPFIINIVCFLLFIPLNYLLSAWLGLPGILVALIVIFSLMMMLFAAMLLKDHQLDFYQLLFDNAMIKTTVMVLVGILPIHYFAGWSFRHADLSVLLMLVSFAMLIGMICLVNAPMRSQIFRLFARRIAND